MNHMYRTIHEHMVYLTEGENNEGENLFDLHIIMC